jgi:hypothetical protein
MLARPTASREGPVVPSPDCDVLQVYLYTEDIPGLDAILALVAGEEATGAVLVNVALTALPTGDNQPCDGRSGEPVMLFTFHCPVSS